MLRRMHLFLCATSLTFLHAETPWIMESFTLEKKDAEKEQEQNAEDAKTLHWKAATFAGVTLLALAGGIAAIIIDGGSSNKNCRGHHHPHPHHPHH